MTAIESLELFRLPWTMSDNGMTWLEPTRQCNITCDACFHTNDPQSRKSLEQIENELRTMQKLRRCDAMLIAGGEPLTHPDIIRITELVRSFNCKPVLITNGVGLDGTMMRELKKAGMFGFTFHVDAHQSRPEWKGRTETELNILRQQYADMAHEVGGLSCSFNITVFPDTLREVPAIVDWAVRNPDKVHVLTLIAVRMLNRDQPWDYFVGTKRIDIGETPYVSSIPYHNLTSQDIFNEICKRLPNFRFNAYLGGTAIATSLKWAIGNHITSKNQSYGSMGRRMMEILQNGHHLFTGKYLAYTKPRLNRQAKPLFLMGLIDKGIRKAAARYCAEIFRNPLKIFEKLYVQSISVVQPTDILPSGELDTCDGCPNKTYWQGRLVSACRFDEYMMYGAPMTMSPKEGIP